MKATSATATAGADESCRGGEAISFRSEESRRVETDFKYEGYLQQQERQIERMKRAESRQIPDWFDYRSVSGLSHEVVEKLTR